MKHCRDLQANGHVAIVGAGPAGLTLAHLLLKRGFGVAVYERDASREARSQGGSLDLRADGGQRAMDAAGLLDAFRAASREDAKAFRMLDSTGKEMPNEGDDTHEDAGPEIDRGDLRNLLLDGLPADVLHWDHRLEAVHEAGDGRWRLEVRDREPGWRWRSTMPGRTDARPAAPPPVLPAGVEGEDRRAAGAVKPGGRR